MKSILSSLKTKLSGESKDSYEVSYKSGRWDHLDGLPELSRYSVIVGYCNLIPNCNVLDVGCGTGILSKHLINSSTKSYTGLDFSEEAIQRARSSMTFPCANYVVCDARHYDASEYFDLIVFNEILYSLPNPGALIKRYANRLRPNGLIVISVHSTEKKDIIWDKCTAILKTVNAIKITNEQNISWNIGAFELIK